MIDFLLFVSAVMILIASIILSIRTRFVQFRLLPAMFKSIWFSLRNKKVNNQKTETVVAHRALFTAMSTTLGISTMISPVIAIHLGGPGALVGYVLTTLFGSAATYTEVSYAVRHRKRQSDGSIMGGPMQYLEALISKPLAQWYAFFCLLLMVAWSAGQSNQLAAILSSSHMADYAIPTPITGIVLAGFVLFVLLGGTKRVANVSAKLVPLMFTVYLGACLSIILMNVDKLPEIFSTVVNSFFAPYELAVGTLIGGVASSLRWGIFKGMHSNEAALGTQTIPNSMTEANATEQGVLAMASTYSAGFIAILSGTVALITETWQSTTIPLGIDMVAASFEQYFSFFGFAIVALSSALFGIGTCIGNSYNGCHCFEYLTNRRFRKGYFIACALFVFLGSISTVTVFWAWSDVVIALVAVPHALSLVRISFSKEETPVYSVISESGQEKPNSVNIALK